MLSRSPMSSCHHGPPSSHTEGEVPPFPVPHPDYYLEDGNLVILVENTLFKLFRSTLVRHSVVFKDLFSLPTGQSGASIEGNDDDNPLHFSGISAIDFERLLWVLYPPSYGSHKAKTIDEWRSILSLATRWEFNDVRELAIRELQVLDMSPIDRICLAQEFDITGRWALSAYIALCERPEPLSLDEAARLGLDVSIRIAQLREQLRARGHRSSNMGGYHSLTRSAALRHDASRGSVGGVVKPLSGRPAERPQWGIAKSFLVQGDSEIPPPVRVASRKVGPKTLSTTIPGTARLVAQAFGIQLGQ
ncbi:hypothetical protein PYCCODRAFT_1001730 [Trametes coccinea BRFM310]|uniref:BTB domain-containing protein n=1 Tax=Trametes coccinea (strain BRFM310) TaxID=1353009 RepID=A0A1Y2IBE1_TRAC3|nr:hypothetical protein PYCCODRAFT_1001730 [Trametes coccinea BRFM310]